MNEDNIKKAFYKLTTTEEFDEKIKSRLEQSGKQNIKIKPRSFAAVAAVLLVVVLVGNVTAYGVSEEYRSRLSEFLNINSENTHYIGSTCINNGIKMNVASTHVVNNTAMIMLVLTKESGDTFKNCMNPGTLEISINDCEQDGYMCYTELSENRLELNIYISMTIVEEFKGGEVFLKIKGLECNESQVTDLNFEDEFEDAFRFDAWNDKLKDAYIEGVWESKFILQEDLDNTVVLENQNKDKRVKMCGRTLQLENVVIADMMVVANATTIGDIEPVTYDLFSSIHPGSGMYYGVAVEIYYENGEVNKMDCMLDNEGNIIAYSLEVIDKESIEYVKIGECVIRRKIENIKE